MRCGWRFGKSVLRAGLGLEHLTEGRPGRPRRDRRLDASPAREPDRQEHEAETSHQREQEPFRAVHAWPVGFRYGGGRLRSRWRVLGKGASGNGGMRGCGRRAEAETHRGPLRARSRGLCCSRAASPLGATRSRCPRPQGQRRDDGSRTCLPEQRTAGTSRRSLRLHGREIRVERLSRRRTRRRWRLGRPRLWLTGRPCGEKRERVHIPVGIGGQANAEVDVRLCPLGIAARADSAHDLAFLDRGTGANPDRSEVDERDRVAVGGANRQAQTFARQLPDEGRDARCRSPDLGTRRRSDVDSPVLATRVRISFGDERAQHWTVDRPGPGLCSRAQEERREDHGREDE
jgi:hypothetical protein